MLYRLEQQEKFKFCHVSELSVFTHLVITNYNLYNFLNHSIVSHPSSKNSKFQSRKTAKIFSVIENNIDLWTLDSRFYYLTNTFPIAIKKIIISVFHWRVSKSNLVKK